MQEYVKSASHGGTEMHGVLCAASIWYFCYENAWFGMETLRERVDGPPFGGFDGCIQFLPQDALEGSAGDGFFYGRPFQITHD